MDGNAMDGPEMTTAPGRDRRNGVALLVLSSIATVAIVVGMIVWVASGGADDEVRSVTPAPTTTTSDSTTTDSTGTVTATTTLETGAPSTSAASTTPSTQPPTSAPTTTDATGFALPEPGAESWLVSSDLIDERRLDLAATAGDVRVFDGADDALRCVGVVGPGVEITTWCGPENVASRFVADRGPDPIVVELGSETGDVTIEPQQPGWALGSNGCSTPMSVLLGGVDPGSLAVTDVVCRGEEAFIGIGSSLFGPGVAPDGGGILAVSGDEGWAVVDFGTSVECSDQADGIDRCALYDVDASLFDALLPIPPTEVLGATTVDVTSVTDRTSDVDGWLGETDDPDRIETIVTDQLVDPEAEIPAVVRRADGLQIGRYRLLVVEVPQLDDAIRAETWAIWIDSLGETAGVTAFSWWTCERGLGDDGLCV